jgi:hypothetical protein
MRTTAWRAGIVGAWLLLHGCGDSSTGEETGASSTATAGGTATTSGGTTAPGTTEGEASNSGTPSTTAADSTGTPGSSGPGEGSTAGSSSAEGAETSGTCEPAPPAGNVCLECVVANCCTAWVACQADEPCACVIDCHVVKGGSLGNCSNQCNLDSELYQAVYFCGQQSCLGTCEWDCC